MSSILPLNRETVTPAECLMNRVEAQVLTQLACSLCPQWAGQEFIHRIQDLARPVRIGIPRLSAADILVMVAAAIKDNPAADLAEVDFLIYHQPVAT